MELQNKSIDWFLYDGGTLVVKGLKWHYILLLCRGVVKTLLDILKWNVFRKWLMAVMWQDIVTLIELYVYNSSYIHLVICYNVELHSYNLQLY